MSNKPYFPPLQVNVEGGFDLKLPSMVKIRQKFHAPKLADITETIHCQLAKDEIKSTIKPGERIAITVGSRGIANIHEMVKLLADELKEWGAKPFLVPAMGSHGGATAEGQLKVLQEFGITEDSIGVPILSSMETVQIATLPSGIPIFIDRHAYEADGIIVMGRVKPHTDFKGAIESGLLKMLGIGLGKHKGASALHAQGFDRFPELVPQAGLAVLQNASIRFGLAILENAYDETAEIVAMAAAEIPETEAELLKRAKAYMPRLLLPEIDVLIVDEIGKDISGTGMDPNITGRTGTGGSGFSAPPIQKLVVLDLSEKTRGNALGIGFADVTTARLFNRIDFAYTYANTITSTELTAAKIPLVQNNDREAIITAIKCCNRIELERARVVRIHNTLELSEIYVSETYVPEMAGRADIEILSAPEPLVFDGEGFLR